MTAGPLTLISCRGFFLKIGKMIRMHFVNVEKFSKSRQ